MMEGSCSDKKGVISKDTSLIDLLFSWSFEDILNEDLLKTQVEKIPESFQSVHHYFGSFLFPLLEETRAELSSSLEVISRAPFAELIFAEESKPHGTLLYNVSVDNWRNKFYNHGKEPYRTLPGDIFVVSEYKPEAFSDLRLQGRTWTLAWVRKVTENGSSSSVDDTKAANLKLKASKDIGVGMQKTMYLIFLMNITTNNRIWNSLHLFGNVNIINEVLWTNSMVEEICMQCSLFSNAVCAEKLGLRLSSELNESQRAAILCSLCKLHCNHKCSFELIWGPPGTGKTKTVSMLLWTIMVIKYRVLTCAPTNVAITEVASRVLKLLKESSETNPEKGVLFSSVGDLLLFGNKDRLKVGSDLEEIYLDYRVNKLVECFGPLTGWKHCFSSMIIFFEDCVRQYDTFLENELSKDKGSQKNNKTVAKSFLGFARESFKSTALPLKRCVQTLATHIPKSFILEHNFQNMAILVELLESFEKLLSQVDLDSEVLKELFSHPVTVQESPYPVVYTSSFLYLRSQCLSVLRALQSSLDHLKLPSVVNKALIEKFCFQRASLIFCTVSSSHKLHSVKMEPVNLLVVDEAAQLKECESVIPLQLPGIRHAVFIGDEYQLSAIVKSKVSDEAGFGRSLFERLSALGHSKHLLNIQYRMHPSVSCFPNSRFYLNKILNAPNVKSRNYAKHYLPGPMFGPYSFINVSGGKEELDDVGHSRKNMVEVAVVMKIVQKLYEAWSRSKMKLSIGVVSPYTAQVVAIQEKLGRNYEKLDSFAVKVKSIDGFQGGEEDIIIISTVRSNSNGSIGFISNLQRTNVALTRARHCLWILGNGTTLANSTSIWEAVVNDAKDRGNFHNADEDKGLAKAIIDAKEDLVQLDDLFNGDSKLYKRSRWKVLFSDNFRKSFEKLKSSQTKKSVISLLLRLSIGWRPKKRNETCVYESSSQILKQFGVAGLCVVSTIDIEKDSKNFQVLKVWDILPLKDVPMLVTCLDSIFRIYTDDFINYCKKKCLDGDLEVPMCWGASHEIVRCKNLSKFEFESILSASAIDEGSALKNSSVIESLLLMKFYSLTYQVVSHLLSGHNFGDLDLPYQVTDQELEIILSPSSIFIVGRPGGGKTTALTTKLLQRERQRSVISEGLIEVQTNFSDVSRRDDFCDGIENVKRTALRQIFITVTPKLCVAVKQQLFQLKRSTSGGNFLAESSSIDMHDIDDTAQFMDIPDSFIDIPLKSYPLVVTFQKFLMMLDGSVGESYFKRFHMVGELFRGKSRQSRSIALYTFIKTKEVNYDRFSSSYWPKFNIQLTKKLDAFTVYTEIISHIKGGLQALEACDGKLSREDYVLQSKGLVSALSRKRRERIYDIYLDYEKRKTENGEFDIADLVIDLHRQLKDKRYEGEEMDYVYIDEVQGLTMSQIALLKYICKNVHEGFVFSGDTAETIARGLDFRFQDVRSLFYKKFVSKPRSDEKDKGTEIRQMSDILHLSQNFHTHVGLLHLAQSVMDLLFHFFPLSTDILCPEKSHSSLGNGESPILLEPRTGENVIISIFGNSRNVGKSAVGFGAEQVILVRNDFARKEITDHIGKQALVLTIMECQGLEFQDVLLYNFFGSSPLKKQWRVIYEYMKEQDMLDVNSLGSYPSFNQAKYSGLCWELKLLYVALTRSRKRLWICENIEELSKPMFEYWKKLNLVQVRRLDDSLVQAMQVASSKEEWISQGIKLYCEGNYGMASMCFERAGDTNREIWAKAAGLRTAANCMRGSNPEMACTALREAADIFNTLGKLESAAHCLIELKEYEKAAAIYLEKYGESRLEDAGDCFFLAECYKLAAEVYARGNHFSKFLSVCTSAKFFDMGLQFIQQLKEHDISDVSMVKVSLVVEEIKHIFLEEGARHYHDLQDNKTMMKFVRAFHSMDSRRTFLKALNCCNDLLLLETESGNFIEAATIAKKKGDLLLEVDLLEKAGHFKDASMLILSYVIANSLWASGNQGWPLKQFRRKEKLLIKAKLLSKNDSDGFHECVCTEANILSNQESTLFEMFQNLSVSERYENLRGVILSARRILDAHLGSNTSKYDWEDKLVTDLIKHSEETISRNHVSVETLVYFWNFWKEKIVNLLQYIVVPAKQDFSEYMSYEEFSLNYLGVRKQFDNQNFIYLLLNSDAYWAGTIKEGSLQRSGNLVSVDAQQFVAAAQSFWCSEVLSVGMKVLEFLRALHMFSIRHSLSVFCRCITAIHILEVTKFLTGSKFLESFIDNNTQQRLFDVGLQSILYLRQNETPDLCVVYGCQEMRDIVHIFLVKCALHYHELQDNRTMLKFVRAFHSMDSKRLFLRTLDCLNELLLLEEESGSFMEAATIAKSEGNILLKADLLEKAGHYKDASMLLLCYVFTNSLWASGSKGWPLKPFKHKGKLLAKATLYAKNDSDGFYEYVCTEANILSNQACSLLEMNQIFSASQRHKNLRGIILSVRKILDAHLRENISNYKWEDELVIDLVKHSGRIISQNGVSVDTLVCFWNIWKDNIAEIFEYLRCLEIQDANYYASHGEFCLNYLGVQKQFSSQDSVYLLLNSDASWAKKIDETSLKRSSGLVSMDACQFVSAARSYWVSEVQSVGMRVLENMKAFYLFSVRNSLSVLCQSMTAIHFFQVIKFLTGPQFFESSTDETLQKFLNLRAQFLRYCKNNVTPDVCIINSSQEIDDIEHFFLKNCALHYHKLHDNKAMMMFVKAFQSMDSKRLFLKSLDCYDELLLLEEESGNFMEATTIARLKGDLLLEVDLLQKAGQFKEAASLVLFYVLANSLWAPDSKGWPLKQFMQKEELLIKAQSLAKNYSDVFYENVCTETDILLDGKSSLLQKKQNLSTSQRNNSLIGEILSARKILDTHLQSNILNYECEDELVTDLIKHAEDKISQNQISIETLVYFWNFWKEKVVIIMEHLEHLETQNVNEYMDYEKFCLNYLGVRKQHRNQNIYQLLNSEADWVRNTDVGSLQRDGTLVSMDTQQFAAAAQSYWCSELHSVGMKVLETLSALYTCSVRNSFSLFRQSMIALHVFEVTKFLMGSKVLKLSTDVERLQEYLESSSEHFLEIVYSIDCTKSMKENIIALRGTGVSREVIKEVISRIVSSKSELTYGKIGRVVMVVFGSGKLPVGLYELIGKRFDVNPSWQAFINELKGHVIASELSEGSVARKTENPGQGSLIFRLHEALSDTYHANWREEFDYISPDCFLYIVERHLLLVSYFQGCFYTSKSCFIEWFICEEWTTMPGTSSASDIKESLGDFHDFMASIVHQLLINKCDTVEWVKRSYINAKEYYQLLVMRLVVLMCLLCVNSGKYFDMLYNFLGMTDISSQLPGAFCDILRSRKKSKRNFVLVLAKALSKIENPLVILSLGDHYQKSLCADAIVISMKDVQHREDILRVLFPQNVKDGQDRSGAVGFKTDSSRLWLSNDDQGKSAKIQSSLNYDGALGQGLRISDDDGAGESIMSSEHLWETFDSLEPLEDGYNSNVKLEKYIHCKNASTTQPSQNSSCNSKEENIFVEVNTMLDELKKLPLALDVSEPEVKNNISTIRERLKKLKLRRMKMEPLSNNMVVQNHTNAASEASQTSIASGSQKKKKDENSKTKESSNFKEGNRKVCKPLMVWEPKAAAAARTTEKPNATSGM